MLPVPLRRPLLLLLLLLLPLISVAAPALAAARQPDPAREPGTPLPHQPGPRAASIAEADLLASVPAHALAVVDLRDAARCHAALVRFLAPLLQRVPGGAALAPAALAAWVELHGGVPLAELMAVLAPGQAALLLLPRGAAGDARPLPLLLSAIDDDARARDCLSALDARLRPQRAAWDWRLAGGVLALGPSAAVAEWQQWRSRGGAALGADPAYLQHRPELPHPGALRVHVDLAAVRALLPEARRTSWGRLDAGGRFFLGPLSRALDASHRLDGVLRFEPDGELELALSIDGCAAADALGRDLLAAGGAPRPLPPTPPGAAGLVSLDRSVLRFCRAADRLLPAGAATQLQSALGVADTVLGRGKLVDDLLAGLREPATLFVLPAASHQRFGVPAPGDAASSDAAAGDAASGDAASGDAASGDAASGDAASGDAASGDPASGDPASDDADAATARPVFVLVVPIADAAVKPILQSGAYRFAAVVSAQRAQMQKTPFLIRPWRAEGLLLHVAAPVLGENQRDPEVEDLSPTMVVAHDHLIVASTMSGALAAARALQPDGAARAEANTAAPRARGDVLRVQCAVVADMIAASSERLAVERVLGEGETLAQARAVLRGFVGVLRSLDTAALSVVPHATGTDLVLKVRRAR